MAPGHIGIFGGTFDPPHLGHLAAAVNVASELALDEIQFVVANIPWQKVGTRPISASAHRLKMVELALQGKDRMSASAVEISRGGESVTADTLEHLRALCSESTYHVILGSDAAVGIRSWKRADVLRSMAEIVIVERPGFASQEPMMGFSCRAVRSPLVDISSSDIRQRVRDGLPIDYLVPEAVADYVLSEGLYQ